jgi:glutathione S-transferase
MLTLYGSSKSRSRRVLWLLGELGLNFEHVPVAPADARTPEHLKLNPNGHVPVLKDDGLILWESMAINLYLAEKYGKAPFWPATPEGHGEAFKWSFWAMTECEPHFVAIAFHRFRLPPNERKEEVARESEEAVRHPMRVLDEQLKGREYLFGRDFTIVDLNVAAVLTSGLGAQYNFAATPTLNAWFQKCTSREAFKKVASMP